MDKDSMIERVAKAVHRCDFPTNALPWQDCLEGQYLNIAKAAIAAMREPTAKMLCIHDENNCVCHTSYSKMIDAALKE